MQPTRSTLFENIRTLWAINSDPCSGAPPQDLVDVGTLMRVIPLRRDLPSASINARSAASRLRDRIENRVNEATAGGEVYR
jgi:hypothetical protein